MEIHRRSIVIDAHVDQCAFGLVYTDEMVQRMREMLDAGEHYSKIRGKMWRMGMDAVTKDEKLRGQYAGIWKKSGVTCVCRAVAVRNLDEILVNISNNLVFHRWGDLLVPATSAEDILRAKEEGKRAVMWGMEGTEGIGFDLDKLNWLHELGVRIVTLTYNRRNLVGDGCTERYQSGLSNFGLMFVEKLNELGMIVDVAHSGYQTTLDAIEASKDPIVFSHTGCRAVYDHDRNKKDEEIKAMADKGGVIGIYAVPSFVGERGTIDEVLDHIDHAVKIAGVDHVGIGTDYDGAPDKILPLIERIAEAKVADSLRHWVTGFRPEHFRKQMRLVGLEDWSKFFNITRGLVSRGYSNQEIQKILGGNILRIFDKVMG